jgi:hypothetical protein
MNLKGFGRMRSLPNFKVLSRHSPVGSEGTHIILMNHCITHVVIYFITCGQTHLSH